MDRRSAVLSAAVSLGLSSAAATRGSVVTSAEKAQRLRPDRQSVLVTRDPERGLGVGPGDRCEFGHRALGLEFPLDRGEEIGVSLRVDLALQDLRGARDCEIRDLVSQRFLRALDLLRDFGLGTARIRSASAFAWALAASIVSALSFSPCAMISELRDFASTISSPIRFSVLARLCLPCSPRRDRRRSVSAASRWRASAAATRTWP
jgi:hypothetical protein